MERNQHSILLKALALLEVNTLDNAVLWRTYDGLQLHALDRHQGRPDRNGLTRRNPGDDDDTGHGRASDGLAYLLLRRSKGSQWVAVTQTARFATHVHVNGFAINGEPDGLAFARNNNNTAAVTAMGERDRGNHPVMQAETVVLSAP